MATFTQQISSTANDGADFNASSYIDDGVGVGVGYTSGLRFTSVSVPSGATITSAALKIYSNNDGGANSVTGVVTGVTGNCPVMGNPNFPSTRPQTTASVALITGNTLTLRTHDVTAIVQEIVNGTWAAGNAMGFILKQTGGSGTQWYQDFIQSSTQCGLLEISYATPYPELIGSVAGTASQSATSVNLSSLTANGRYGIIAVMTANQTLAAPSGWTEVVPASGSPFRGTAGAAGGVRLTLFERPLDGSETSVSIGDSGDIQYPVAFVFSGQGGASVAIDASIAGNAAASTSGTFSGPTSSAAECLFAYFVATDRDSAAASWSSNANSTIGNSTERYDAGTATGTGGGIALFTSEKATSGAGGNTTATQAASAAYCWITLALKNAASGPVTYNESLTETGTVAQTATTAAIFPSAATESATALASEVVGLVMAGAVSEAATAGASEAGTPTFAPAITEALTVAESSTTTASFSASASEAVTGSDSGATAATWPAARSESIAANDNAAAVATMPVDRSESLSAADAATGSVVGGATVYDDVLSEGIAAADAATTALTTAGTRSEALSAVEAGQASAMFGSARSEALTAADSSLANAVLAASIDELIAANDDEAAAVTGSEQLAEAVTVADSGSATGGTEIKPPEVPANRHATTQPGMTSAQSKSTNRGASRDPDLRNATTPKGKRAA